MNLKFKKNAVLAKECTFASCFGLRGLAFQVHSVERGWGQAEACGMGLGGRKGGGAWG